MHSCIQTHATFLAHHHPRQFLVITVSLHTTNPLALLSFLQCPQHSTFCALPCLSSCLCFAPVKVKKRHDVYTTTQLPPLLSLLKISHFSPSNSYTRSQEGRSTAKPHIPNNMRNIHHQSTLCLLFHPTVHQNPYDQTD